MSIKRQNRSIIRKMVMITVIALILGASCFFGGVLLAKRQSSPKTVITSDTLFQQLQSISSLATLEYHYTNMGKFEKNADLNGWTIPLTKASFILAYDGKITAGISLEDLKIEVEDKKIIITLPEASVLSHEVDEESIEIYDESNNLFNPISISDYAAFSKQQKKIMETKAIEGGLLEQAQKKAGDVIKQLLNTANPGYELVIKEIAE